VLESGNREQIFPLRPARPVKESQHNSEWLRERMRSYASAEPHALVELCCRAALLLGLGQIFPFLIEVKTYVDFPTRLDHNALGL